MDKVKATENLSCPYCLELAPFKRHRALKKHLKSHECRKCNQIFPNIEDVKGHYDKVHLSCPYCPELEPFKDQQALKRHMKLHVCPKCNKIFPNLGDLKAHYNDVHLKCPLCPKRRPFKDETALKQHMQTHQENRIPKYPCQVGKCPKVFQWKKHLDRHIKDDHRQNCFATFQNEVKYGPIFPCTCCERDLFQRGVKFKYIHCFKNRFG